MLGWSTRIVDVLCLNEILTDFRKVKSLRVCLFQRILTVEYELLRYFVLLSGMY